MKTVAIISKPSKPELGAVAPGLVRWMKDHNYRVIVDQETGSLAEGCEVVDRETIGRHKPAFVVVLGGDGTLLAAARAVASSNVPILGVNLGSLGFLTEVPVSELYPTLEAIEGGQATVEKRAMLHCELQRDGKTVAKYDALNDIVISKSAISRLFDFDLYLDRTFVSDYKADGVIVSTPTGSTAYSLAAGGPILTPTVDALVITPVCPHSLTHRPLVVRDSVEISIAVKAAGEECFLSSDGQVGTPVKDGDRVVCRKSDDHVSLLRIKRTFFEVLRNKLKWGQR